jgi:hypothetical protein
LERRWKLVWRCWKEQTSEKVQKRQIYEIKRKQKVERRLKSSKSKENFEVQARRIEKFKMSQENREVQKSK